MINLEIINSYNPWWRTKLVPSKKLGKKRDFLKKIIPDVARRQILLLSGLRRVGKTTLIHQLIQQLLKDKTNPLQILYFSFEEEKKDIFELVKFYEQEILQEEIESYKKIYLFLDEIQKVRDWTAKLKRIYDLYPNIKIIALGSATLDLEKRGKESLAGRAIFYNLDPLEFSEYLRFRKIEFNSARIKLYQQDLNRALRSYLIEGGFIEIIGEDREFISRYFKELLIERVIYKDIPQTFNLDEPDLAFRILKIISENPGMLVDYRNLASDLKRDWRTIKKYLDYLEYSFLVKKVYNFSPNLLTSEKKLKKYYPTVASISFALYPERLVRGDFVGKLVETLIANQSKSSFFWRTSQGKEVDFIIESGRKKDILALEVKYQEKVLPKNISGIVSFCRKYKRREALVVTKSTEGVKLLQGINIKFIPLLRYLLKI